MFYTSHFLDDVLDLADRIVVLRDGALVMDQSREGLTREVLVSKCCREILQRRPGYVLNRLVQSSSTSRIFARQAVSQCRHIEAGEVLGIWGLLGAGRTEIRGRFSDWKKKLSANFGDRRGRGLGTSSLRLTARGRFVTETAITMDFLNLPVWKNITAGSGRRYAGGWVGWS